jgi:hypothetical protein
MPLFSGLCPHIVLDVAIHFNSVILNSLNSQETRIVDIFRIKNYTLLNLYMDVKRAWTVNFGCRE